MKHTQFAVLLAALLAFTACSPEPRITNVTATETEYVDKEYAKAVTFSTVPNEENDAVVTVRMETKTAGAEIYYTTDDSEPSAENGTKYTGPVPFATSTVLKAIAIKNGVENSPVSVVNVSIAEKTITYPAPEFSTPGTYTVYHLQQQTTGGTSPSDYDLISGDTQEDVYVDNNNKDDIKKTYPGFSAVSMTQNGNAIYVYYDRNPVTYTFSLGSDGIFADGSTEKEVTGLYGASVKMPLSAEISAASGNSVFFKWKCADGNRMPAVYGSEALTISAQWRNPDDDEVSGFVKVKGGTIQGKYYSNNYEGVFVNDRTVTLSDFYMGRYEVTQDEYKKVMQGQTVTVDETEYTLNAEPSACTEGSTYYAVDFGKEQGKRPVENVTWYDAVWYCNARSTKEGLEPAYSITVTDMSYDGTHIEEAEVTLDLSKNGYRLPTEAEWEYAARGGDPNAADWNYTFSGEKTAAGKSYNDSINAGMDTVGWYKYNNKDGTTGKSDATNSADGRGTHQVGQKQPNALGLYDMSGNVREWCWDWYDWSVPQETVTNPTGPESGSNRVYRGGSWYRDAFDASVRYRNNIWPHWNNPDYGFRVVRSAGN